MVSNSSLRRTSSFSSRTICTVCILRILFHNSFHSQPRDFPREGPGSANFVPRPTPLRNRYFVREWNFSNVDAAGDFEQITDSLRRHVRSRAKTFAVRYEDVLARPVETDGNATEILESLLPSGWQGQGLGEHSRAMTVD